MAIGDGVQTFDITTISSVRFGSATSAPAGNSTAQSEKPATASAASKADRAREPDPAPPVPSNAASGVSSVSPATRSTAASTAKGGITIPSGTALVVQMIDSVDSERDGLGQTFRASLDEAVVIDGQTAIPRNVDVVLKLVDDKQSGRLTGRTELTLDIQSITVNGRQYDVTTSEVTEASESRTGQTAKRTGGAAALGAVIGAIAGGGKGAAIGAVTGAAAGGAVQVLTKGPQVRIPSETRLTFNLQQPLTL